MRAKCTITKNSRLVLEYTEDDIATLIRADAVERWPEAADYIKDVDIRMSLAVTGVVIAEKSEDLSDKDEANVF